MEFVGWGLGLLSIVLVGIVGYAFLQIDNLHKRHNSEREIRTAAFQEMVAEFGKLAGRVGILETEHVHSKDKAQDHGQKIDKLSTAIGELGMMNLRMEHVEKAMQTMARAMETVAARMPRAA